MKLNDTIELMKSSDYKERFKAEYYQVKIRYEKLKAMLVQWDNGELKFTPTCSRAQYEIQKKAMLDYISTLETRANIEGIDLSE